MIDVDWDVISLRLILAGFILVVVGLIMLFYSYTETVENTNPITGKIESEEVTTSPLMQLEMSYQFIPKGIILSTIGWIIKGNINTINHIVPEQIYYDAVLKGNAPSIPTIINQGNQR